MSNVTDPRNDRPADLDAPPPRCGLCHNRVNDDARETCDGCSILCLCEGSRVPLTHVPVDSMGPCCDQCAEELTRERLTEEAWGRSEAVQAAMTCNHALKLAVEAALGATNLLNGGGAHPDDEEEDETREIAVESMSELVHGRRTEAA